MWPGVNLKEHGPATTMVATPPDRMQDRGMNCSTCGSSNTAGRAHCDTCGVPLADRSRSLPAGEAGGAAAIAISDSGQCPHCGYRGNGAGYFSNGSHLAALLIATILTAIGGIAYYALRHDYQICPRCGRNWDKSGERAVVRFESSEVGVHDAPPMPSRQSSKGGWSLLLLLMAAVLRVIGLAAGEIMPIVFALAAGGGGVMLRGAANRERQERRAALISSLQLPVLRLAAEREGRLTVSEVAAGLGWTIRRSEKVLQSLEDGLRVESEVTDEGVIVYEFRELRRIRGPTLPPERDETNY